MEKGLVVTKAKKLEGDYEDQQLSSELTESDPPLTQAELDFVELPSEDFFCPVTFELLLNPHQTRCCGHHLSERAVSRLLHAKKSCPLCKNKILETVPDIFFKRKTSAVLIRCPHKASGCEWVGEVGKSKQHTEACPKRAWKCQYCDFESTFEVAAQHEDECTKYPIPCPNKCMVPLVSEASPFSETRVCMIPRCDLEKHCAECPLEVVDCEFVDGGCKVKTTRQDLKRHMEESQQEHLLSATMLNLRLTKETIAEKDRLLAEKDKIIAMKDQQILETLTQLLQGVFEFTGGILGFTCHRFTLEKFHELQKTGSYGDWHSEPFYSNSGEYQLQLSVETRERGTHMFVRLKSDDRAAQGRTFIVALQLLNQQGNHDHFFRSFELLMKSFLELYSTSYNYIPFEQLYRIDSNIQYLKDDCLKFVLWIKEKQL